jgi:uncharacterized membrane protein
MRSTAPARSTLDREFLLFLCIPGIVAVQLLAWALYRPAVTWVTIAMALAVFPLIYVRGLRPLRAMGRDLRRELQQARQPAGEDEAPSA